jgi:hypothetical protein
VNLHFNTPDRGLQGASSLTHLQPIPHSKMLNSSGLGGLGQTIAIMDQSGKVMTTVRNSSLLGLFL